MHLKGRVITVTKFRNQFVCVLCMCAKGVTVVVKSDHV